MATGSSRAETRTVPLMARLMNGSMAVMFRRLGIRASTEPRVTEEDVQGLLKEGIQAGDLEEIEQEILKRVFRLGQHRANELMTPMKDVVWLDVADSPDLMQRKIAESPHSRFPVCEGSIDNVLGIVQIKDLLVQSFNG